MRKSFVFGILLLLAAVRPGLASQDARDMLEPGSMSFEGKLQLDGYYHKLGSGWSVTGAGGGINKNYSYAGSTVPAADGETFFGETFFLNIGFRPTGNLRGSLDLEFIADYADRYWMPVNLEHRMSLNNQKFNWNRAEIEYSAEWFKLRYFRNIGHASWKDKGDLFNLFPAQYENGRYLRVSGRSIPEGYELDLEGKAGRLELIYGPEVIWDYKNGFYANYSFNALGLNSNLMYRSHIIPYGEPDERMSAAELSTNIGISRHSLQLGVLYQPFRLDREYIHVDYVRDGEGYLDTRFDRRTGSTGVQDAFGYSAKLTLDKLPLAKEITLKLSHLGLAAGNKQQIDTQITERISRSLTGCFEYTYKKPLLGAVPYVIEGTLANPGPPLLEPRDMHSPFWVSWNNEASGWDNREASLMSFIFTFDPTPDTWFYNLEPNVPEEWNINPGENAPLSVSVKYSLSRYFGSTDRLLYWNENGRMIWEGPLSYEPWATDGYVGDFTMLARILSGKSVILYSIGGGESLAINGFAYTESTAKEKPATSYFTTGLSYQSEPYNVKLKYSQDIWGPEEWHRSYGQAFDKLYQAHVSRKFGDSFLAGLEYVGARETDDKYYAPELGDYDEFRLFLTISFGPLILFTGEAPVTGPQVGESPLPSAPQGPKVSVDLPAKAFSPSEGKQLEIRGWAADLDGINSWQVTISDPSGKTVKTFSGEGQPPFAVYWNGNDDISGSAAPPGAYSLVFQATNGNGITSGTPAADFTVNEPLKPAPLPAPKEVKITETERGLLVSMTSKVLFDSGKSELKAAAGKSLDELVGILNAYKSNRISVEGHTDATGDASVNQELSERRARNVADYLIKSGIAEGRISVSGFGKSKPVAENTTAAGREANRRVEVIILKQ